MSCQKLQNLKCIEADYNALELISKGSVLRSVLLVLFLHLICARKFQHRDEIEPVEV